MNNKITYFKHNSEYEEFLKEEKVRLARIISVLGGLLYGSFILVDYFALASAFNIAVSIRLMVIFVLTIGYFYTYSPKFIKHYSFVISLQFVATIGGVETMMFLATPLDYAYSTYFAGVMIVLIALYSWTYLNVTLTALLSVSALAGYFFIDLYVRGMVVAESYPVLITNTFMLVSAIVFGLLAQILRNSYLKENFLLQQSLSKALDEKTEEAEDNAYMANHDALTGLANRRYVTEQLENALEIAKAKDKLLVILFIDLNGFKQINDIYGHAVGDEVLIITARRLELAVRKDDCLSRLGGDEYLIGLNVAKENLSEVESMVEKYDTIISDPIKIDGVKLQVGASIGVAAYPIHGNKIKALMDIADMKMYQVKHGKKDAKLGRDKNDTTDAVVMFPGRSKH